RDKLVTGVQTCALPIWPVVTTHGGPAHLIRHEDTGLITYDNPGSMVWAIDRLLGDPGHAERMGHNGRRSDNTSCTWDNVAGHYRSEERRVGKECRSRWL